MSERGTPEMLFIDVVMLLWKLLLLDCGGFGRSLGLLWSSKMLLRPAPMHDISALSGAAANISYSSRDMRESD